MFYSATILFDGEQRFPYTKSPISGYYSSLCASCSYCNGYQL